MPVSSAQSDDGPRRACGALSIASTTATWTPEDGCDAVDLYTGAGDDWQSFRSPAVSVTLTVSNNARYDLFFYRSGNQIALQKGAAWASGSSRGTGAGSAEIALQNGVWVNAVDIAGLCAAKLCRFAGTIQVDGAGAIALAQAVFTGSFTAPRTVTVPDANSTLLVDRDYGDVPVSGNGQTMTIDSAAVSGAKIADGGITSSNKLADGIVTTAKIADANVSTGKLADDAVTYAKIQNISATQRILGRKTSGAGDTEEMTITELLDFLGSTRGSIVYRGASGWVLLAPGTSGYFLQSAGAGADPAWAAAAGSGDVTAAANFATDNSCIRADGTAKGVQGSGATCTIDDSGNQTLAGAITTGGGSSAAGYLDLKQGTAPSAGTTSVRRYAPTSVTSYTLREPGAAASGILRWAHTSGDVVQSVSELSGDVTTSGSNVAQLATKHTTGQIMYLSGCDNCAARTDTDDQSTFFLNLAKAITITQVWCQTDSGTSVINIQRSDNSQNVMSSNLTCTTGGASGTIDTAQDNIAVNTALNFVMVTGAASGTPKSVRVAIKYTVD